MNGTVLLIYIVHMENILCALETMPKTPCKEWLFVQANRQYLLTLSSICLLVK